MAVKEATTTVEGSGGSEELAAAQQPARRAVGRTLLTPGGQTPNPPEPSTVVLASLTAMVTATFLDRLVYRMLWAGQAAGAVARL